MTQDSGDDVSVDARSVFAGLSPSRRPAATGHNRVSLDRLRNSRAVYSTVPFLLASSVAMYLNATGPIETAEAAQPHEAPSTGLTKATVRPAVLVASATAPETYRVVAGDNVSKIAARFGLSTTSVLALNGLGTKSLIFPGQVLRLTSGPVLAASKTPIAQSSSGRYIVEKGDSISAIAARHGVSTKAVLSANGLVASSIIRPGQSIVLPGMVLVSSVTPAPAAATPTPATAGVYVIKTGDSVTTISKKFGVSAQSILNANGLTHSSLIYSGRSLVVPGATSATAGLTNVTLLSNEMEANAKVIVGVGRQLGISDYGIIIALSAAMQESGMLNINYGHLDSVGLFQQRPSVGWGTVGQLTNATYSARLFYGGPTNPNKGKTRGLLDIAGWQAMTVTQAAQKVQVSAYPNAYAKWESSARFWLANLG